MVRDEALVTIPSLLQHPLDSLKLLEGEGQAPADEPARASLGDSCGARCLPLGQAPFAELDQKIKGGESIMDILFAKLPWA